jgi:hypothetical protein
MSVVVTAVFHPDEIVSEQSGDYQQDKGQVAAENTLAGHPDVDLVMGLNEVPDLQPRHQVLCGPGDGIDDQDRRHQARREDPPQDIQEWFGVSRTRS